MRLAFIQRDHVLADFAGIAAALRTDIAAAAAAGATLAVLPELAAFGGYPPRDLLDRQALVERQWRMIDELARELPIPVVLGAVELLGAGPGPRLANAAVVLDRGGIAAIYRKRLLPTYDVFDDARHFRAGDTAVIAEVAGVRLGLTVCEDLWPAAYSGRDYGVDPLADLVGRCDLIVNLSASPYHVQKPALRARLLAEVAARAGCPVAYANQVGAHDELLFDGGSQVVAADGRCLGTAPRWREAVTVIDISAPGVACTALDPREDLADGLACGIRAYCRKTRQAHVVLGLSGGIDSAVVATLAVDALGRDAVTGLLMPGPYSSRGSIIDAMDLAQRLGIRSETLAIHRAFDVLCSELDPLGTLGDLTTQNLQSRLRGVLVMAAANQLGAMALTTGNKSELATGYCTIYGDMNGGLAPIGDLYKTEVWDLARTLNRDGERIPEASIRKAPSAELRPDQTDQDNLPPYDVLDRILRPYLESDRDAEALIAAGEDPALVARIVRLVELNEFKRRQGAPVLRVSPKAFGSGRRMPIARAIGEALPP